MNETLQKVMEDRQHEVLRHAAANLLRNGVKPEIVAESLHLTVEEVTSLSEKKSA